MRLNDNGKIYNAKNMAGMVGNKATSSGQILDETDDDIELHPLHIRSSGELLQREYTTAIRPEQEVLDSIQPVSGWWIYEPEDPGMEEARQAEKKAIDDEVAAMENVAQLDSKMWFRLMDLLSRLEELAGF